MFVTKVGTLFLFILTAVAEKKIELVDIEEDNLNSEKENKLDQINETQPAAPEERPPAEEFLKSELPIVRYPNTPLLAGVRYAHQYDVTEQPESHFVASAPSETAYQSQNFPPNIQQTVVGYLSNFPMRIYLVPQSEQEQETERAKPQPVQFFRSGAPIPHVIQYPSPVTTAVPYPLVQHQQFALPDISQTAHFITPDTYKIQTTQFITPQTPSPQTTQFIAPRTPSPQTAQFITPRTPSPQTTQFITPNTPSVQTAQLIRPSTHSSQTTQFIVPASSQVTQYNPSSEALLQTNKLAYFTPPEDGLTSYNKKYVKPPKNDKNIFSSLFSPLSGERPMLYQSPVKQHSTSRTPSTGYTKYYGKNNDIDPDEGIGRPRYYTTQKEPLFANYNSPSEYPRYYDLRTPIREDYRHGANNSPSEYPRYYNSPTPIREDYRHDANNSPSEYPRYYDSRTPIREDYRHDAHNSPTEYPSYHDSRTPIREDYRHGAISEIPTPNPLILKNPPAHLAHLPRTLPTGRPVYNFRDPSGSFVLKQKNKFSFNKKPASLLASYIPSTLQVEYMRRGHTENPQHAYEVLSRVQEYLQKQNEKGFLPNQMYHTAEGGTTYAHYNQHFKGDKGVRKQ